MLNQVNRFKHKYLSSGLIVAILLFATPSYSFSKAETKELFKQCISNTQQQYGYSIQLSQNYCNCSIPKTIAYMKKHNLKQGVKPPPGTDKKLIAQTFIDIAVNCARKTLTK